MPREALSIFICSHVLMEIFRFYEMTKRGGRFVYSCVLLRFSQHPRGAHTLKWPPSSGERTCTGTYLLCNVNARFHVPYCVYSPILLLHMDMLVCFCGHSTRFFELLRTKFFPFFSYDIWRVIYLSTRNLTNREKEKSHMLLKQSISHL
jgi:hypothetical protein